MRLRIFQAFASNNSGSYTIVGRFTSEDVAHKVAEILRNVCAEHEAWHERGGSGEEAESPLDAFARQYELSEERPGRDQDWPEYGDPPSVLAVGGQVLVYAPYTVTMPRLFGEFFYKQGGRVDVELDHAHEPLVVEFILYIPGLSWNDPEGKRRIEEFEGVLAPILIEHSQLDETEHRGAVDPVIYRGTWGERRASAVLRDIVAGVEAVRSAAESHDIALAVSIRQWPKGLADPLAHLRGGGRPWGPARVILWAPCEDRTAALKAVREALNTDLEEAKGLLEDLPREILVDVDYAFAQRATGILCAAGCDAEAFVPGDKEHVL